MCGPDHSSWWQPAVPEDCTHAQPSRATSMRVFEALLLIIDAKHKPIYPETHLCIYVYNSVRSTYVAAHKVLRLL